MKSRRDPPYRADGCVRYVSARAETRREVHRVAPLARAVPVAAIINPPDSICSAVVARISFPRPRLFEVGRPEHDQPNAAIWTARIPGGVGMAVDVLSVSSGHTRSTIPLNPMTSPPMTEWVSVARHPHGGLDAGHPERRRGDENCRQSTRCHCSANPTPPLPRTSIREAEEEEIRPQLETGGSFSPRISAQQARRAAASVHRMPPIGRWRHRLERHADAEVCGSPDQADGDPREA